jgi:hypothetical protein
MPEKIECYIQSWKSNIANQEYCIQQNYPSEMKEK